MIPGKKKHLWKKSQRNIFTYNLINLKLNNSGNRKIENIFKSVTQTSKDWQK